MDSETTSNTTTQHGQSDTETATTTETTDQPSDEVAPSEAPRVSLDNVFEILKNQRRRQVLQYLAEREEPVSLRDLSAYVAAEENEKSIAQLSSQERKRVYVGLYQCHLPKMDDMGFIQYNKDRGFIELGPAAVHAEKYLQQNEEPDRQWPTYYLGLVSVGWLLLLGGFALAPLTTIVASGIFLALLMVLAVAHAYTLRGETDRLTFATPTTAA